MVVRELGRAALGGAPQDQGAVAKEGRVTKMTERRQVSADSGQELKQGTEVSI